jgi:RNA polymerase sigma factor (sigma-70 family)
MELIKSQTDVALLEAIRHSSQQGGQHGGLEEAIGALYRDHFESLAWLVKNNSGSQQDAEDIFQDVLVSFIELVQQGRFRGDSTVKTFLYSMMKNSWLNELKRRGRSNARELKYELARPQEETDVSSQIAEMETKQQLAMLVEKLGEGCKKILLLFYYENQSMKEILEHTDYENEQVVRNKKYKCLKQLEQLIAAHPILTQTFKNILHG